MANTKLDIRVTENYDEMSKVAAEVVAEYVKANPEGMLGLATGSTPIGLYDCLVEMYEKGELDFSKMRSFNLDEYYPMTPDNDQSYRWFMDHYLFDRVNIDKANTRVPDGCAADPVAFCASYDADIKAAGGIGLQVLGLGENGHIGFNEPADELIGGTHLTDLTESTLVANSRNFASIDDMPRQAITMGMDGILSAGQIVLMVSGAKKHDALMALITEDETPHIPVTYLKKHANLVVVCDKAAYNG